MSMIMLPITIGTRLYTMMSKTKYEAFMTLADRRPTDIGKVVLYQEDIIGRAVNDQEIRVLNLANTVSSYTVLKGAYDELTNVGVIKADDTPLIDFVREVTVEPLRGTEYLQVGFIDTDPEVARQVIDTVYGKFMARYRQLTTEITEESSDFIAKALADAKAAYDATLQKQMEFQERYPGGIAYDVSTQGLVAQLGQAKQRLWEAERNQVIAQGQFTVASRQLEELGTEPPDRQEVLNPVWNEVEARIAQSQSTLTGLRENYGAKHPRVLAIEQSIAEDRALLANTDKFISVTSERGRSAVWLDSTQAKNQAQRAIDSARQEKANAQSNIAALTAQIDELPIVQKELSSLDAELRAQQLIVSELTSKLSEATVREAQSQSPNIFMLDNPIYREVPRNTALKTLIALFLSSIVAISLI